MERIENGILMNMRRSWIIAGIVGLLLVGSVLFFVFRQEPVQEEVLPEGTIEESIDKEGESTAQVLEVMPKPPDFTSITEAIFFNEGVEEAKSFETKVVVPIQDWQKVVAAMRASLEKKEVNWCDAFVASSVIPQDTVLTNEAYQEELQEERQIRDVKFLAQAMQVGEEWSMWLVRLTEAANRESKEKEDDVEDFQESFNEITDEYEETLYQSAQEARSKIDRVIFSEKDVVAFSQNMARELAMGLEKELALCRAGKALEESEYTRVARTIAQEETRLANRLTAKQNLMNRILDIPPTVTMGLVSKTKDYTMRFEAAIVELQQDLR